MPEFITMRQALLDAWELDRTFRQLGELLEAAVSDGRLLPEHMREPLQAALPDALESLDGLRANLWSFIENQLVVLELRQPFGFAMSTLLTLPASKGRPDRARLDQPFTPQQRPTADMTAIALVEHGLIGASGRAKTRAFREAFWGWGRKHGKRWLRKALALGAIPLNSFATGTMTGKAITEFAELVGEVLGDD